ncbi:hypothetical protein AXF42_Ash014929 [Apostasia shenzhenica]|uniref:Uncharacterized protein n=1 Tax=Apostasia shenzhenica TaxID=1088818 RepID=A0A2I0ALU6_9ASPA|nr:hypothetical protein AXF42_Ash014929 [Apostasia shenzhenica]
MLTANTGYVHTSSPVFSSQANEPVAPPNLQTVNADFLPQAASVPMQSFRSVAPQISPQVASRNPTLNTGLSPPVVIQQVTTSSGPPTSKPSHDKFETRSSLAKEANLASPRNFAGRRYLREWAGDPRLDAIDYYDGLSRSGSFQAMEEGLYGDFRGDSASIGQVEVSAWWNRISGTQRKESSSADISLYGLLIRGSEWVMHYTP